MQPIDHVKVDLAEATEVIQLAMLEAEMLQKAGIPVISAVRKLALGIAPLMLAEITLWRREVKTSKDIPESIQRKLALDVEWAYASHIIYQLGYDNGVKDSDSTTT